MVSFCQWFVVSALVLMYSNRLAWYELVISYEQLASYSWKPLVSPSLQTLRTGERSGTGRQPGRQLCLTMMNCDHFCWLLQFCSGDRKHVLLWLFNGEGWGGVQKQRTHTPRPEDAHIDTLWEQGRGRGSKNFRGLGSSFLVQKWLTAGYGQVTWSKICIL